MNDLEKALAAARDRLSQYEQTPDDSLEETMAGLDCIESLRDILDAFDAARGQAVAWVDVADAENGPYNFHGIEKLPSGKHHLYAAPSAALAVPAGWREHVEDRIRTWRQSFVNRHGDQLEILDFMGSDSLDDLIDYVCSGQVQPAALAVPEAAALVQKWREQANAALRRSGTWNGNDMADRIERMADELAAMLAAAPAQQPAAAVPAGYALVPAEPTTEMMHAGAKASRTFINRQKEVEHLLSFGEAKDVYKAMLWQAAAMLAAARKGGS